MAKMVPPIARATRSTQLFLNLLSFNLQINIINVLCFFFDGLSSFAGNPPKLPVTSSATRARTWPRCQDRVGLCSHCSRCCCYHPEDQRPPQSGQPYPVGCRPKCAVLQTPNAKIEMNASCAPGERRWDPGSQ